MSFNWPDGWSIAALSQADLPVSDFTKRALLAWQVSTPILSYTNNPLGFPAIPGKTSELMKTGYAMYATMGDFRAAFTDLLASPTGQPLRDALALGEKYSNVWRAVNALKLPASKTETDYPSGVLDLTSESYRESVQSVTSPADRKTAGTAGTQTGFGSSTGDAARSAANTANVIQQATKAVSNIPGRMR